MGLALGSAPQSFINRGDINGWASMNPVYLLLDPYLIWFYRITGWHFIDFLIGTFTLGIIATAVGEFTISVVFLINRKYIAGVIQDATRYQDLAVKAASSSNDAAYVACNDMANEAFGKSFFTQIALSAASLWPVFFAVDWMRYRFDDVQFQLLFTDNTVGFVCVFIAMYAAARLVFSRVKYRIPYFRRIREILDVRSDQGSQAQSTAGLAPGNGRSPERELVS
jgi:hypothetical protein